MSVDAEICVVHAVINEKACGFLSICIRPDVQQAHVPPQTMLEAASDSLSSSFKVL